MNRAELVMRRVNVRAFIKADPVLIQVTRTGPPVKNEQTGGTLPGVNIPVQLQQARIILNKRRYNNGITNVEAGEIPHTDYLLVAEYFRDFQVNDEFQWLDVNYRITGRYENRQESILCSIDLLGADNGS